MTVIVTADNLPRVIGCNGFLSMEPSHPRETDNAAAAEGTAAHYMAVTVYRGERTIEELIDRKAPSGAYMSPEMATHVTAYLDNLPGVGCMELDTSYAGDGWEVRGRCDYAWYNADDLVVDADGVVISEPGTLHIRDFKYGYTLVEPEMHWTLISHAIGYCIRNNVAPQRIDLSIHQPRPWHPDGRVRSWIISYTELLEHYGTIVNTLYKPDGILRTGPYCDRCDMMATCPAYRQASNKSHDATSRAFTDVMPNDELSIELDLIAASMHTLKNRKQALEELASYRIKKGEVVENYAREQGYGHRKWNDGLTPDILKVLTGVDLATEPGLHTPAEAERRGVPESVITSLTTKPKTAMKLVRVTANTRAKRLLKNKPT